MWKKLKNYYRNSPKRIGWTWVGIHLFFLMVGMALLNGGNVLAFLHPAAIGFTFFAMLLFPVSLVMNFPTFGTFLPDWAITVPFFIFSLGYYTLFFVMRKKAIDTSTQAFYLLHAVFALWFLLNIISSIHLIFSQNFA